tara:strand:- start:1 stop:438 length:438 start_codon:yes stop_codon:yes gene_type:complete
MLNENFKNMGKRKSSNSYSCGSNSRYYYLLTVLWISGCTSLKKAGLVGAGALVPGAIASIATSGTAPVLLASAVGASVTSVVADQTITQPTALQRGQDMTSCAPDNFWTLLGDLVSMGGWFLILVVIVPMVLGWLLPGPLERKKR